MATKIREKRGKRKKTTSQVKKKPTRKVKPLAAGKAAKRAKQDQFLSKIIEWEAEGYDTSYMHDLLKNDSPDLDKEFERIEENVNKIREFKNMVFDIHAVEAEAQAFVESLKHPESIEEVEKRYKTLNEKIRLRNLHEEFESLNIEGMESDARKVRDLLREESRIDEAERELKNLKTKIRERFFVTQIRKEIKVIEPKREVMGKLAGLSSMEESRMFVEDIFLLYQDCRFISHHTRTVRAEKERGKIFRMLKAMRDFIRHSKNYQNNQLFKFPYENGNILVYGSGKVILGLFILGKEPSWTEAIIYKALTLMSDKYFEILEEWDGDTKNLEGLNRFINVLMLTFERLEAKTA